MVKKNYMVKKLNGEKGLYSEGTKWLEEIT